MEMPRSKYHVMDANIVLSRASVTIRFFAKLPTSNVLLIKS